MPFHLSIPSSAELNDLLPETISVPSFKGYFHTSAFQHALLPVLTSNQQDVVQMMSWGLIPHDTTSLGAAKAIRNKTLNAKSETLFTDPVFYNYAPHNRCLIFVNGFFEWRQRKKEKQPHFIHKTEFTAFALAGVYAEWAHPELYSNYSCSIITTEAEGLLSLVNNTTLRMPLLLPKEKWSTWLDSSKSPDEIVEMLAPFDDPELNAYQVSELINASGQKTDVPEVQEKVADFTMDAEDFF